MQNKLIQKGGGRSECSTALRNRSRDQSFRIPFTVVGPVHIPGEYVVAVQRNVELVEREGAVGHV